MELSKATKNIYKIERTEDGKILGFISFLPVHSTRNLEKEDINCFIKSNDVEVMHVFSVYIDENFRQSNISKMLSELIVAYNKDFDITAVCVSEDGHRFFKKLDFVKIEKVEDCCLYIKKRF